jgi:hypothetical protein
MNQVIGKMRDLLVFNEMLLVESVMGIEVNYLKILGSLVTASSPKVNFVLKFLTIFGRNNL